MMSKSNSVATILHPVSSAIRDFVARRRAVCFDRSPYGERLLVACSER
jgi:hypothetical protein